MPPPNFNSAALIAALNALRTTITAQGTPSPGPTPPTPSPSSPGDFEKAQEKQEAAMWRRLQQRRDELDLNASVEEQEKANIAIMEAQVDLYESLEDKGQDHADALKNLRKEIKRINKEREKENKGMQASIGAYNDLARDLTGLIGIQDSYIDKIKLASKAMSSNSEEAIKARAEVAKTINVQNVAMAAGKKAMQGAAAGIAFAFSATEDVVADYNRVTGRGAEMTEQLQQSMIRLLPYGAQITNALTSLERAFPTNQLQGFTQGIAESFALWERFGVSTDSAAQSFTDLVKAFGEAPLQARDIQRDMMELGLAMKKPPGEMLAAFQQAMPRLSLYAGQLKDNFSNVAIASAQLSVSTDTILGFNDSLKTISGAADFASKLNSIVGQGLADPMRFMEKAFEDPLAPLMEVRRIYKLAGKDISQVAGAELDMMAKHMGVDAPTFKKMLTGKIDTSTIKKKLEEGKMDEKSIALKSSKMLEKIFNILKFFVGKWFGVIAKDLGKLVDNWIKGNATGLGVGAGGAGTTAAETLARKKAGIGPKGVFQQAQEMGGNVAGVLATGTALGYAPWLKKALFNPARDKALASASEGLLKNSPKALAALKRLPAVGAAVTVAASGLQLVTGKIGKWEATLQSIGSIGGGAAGFAAGGLTMAAAPVLAPAGAVAGAAAGGAYMGKLGAYLDKMTGTNLDGDTQVLAKITAENGMQIAQAVNNLAEVNKKGFASQSNPAPISILQDSLSPY